MGLPPVWTGSPGVTVARGLGEPLPCTTVKVASLFDSEDVTPVSGSEAEMVTVPTFIGTIFPGFPASFGASAMLGSLDA